MTEFSRSRLLLGDKIENLYRAHVAVFGIGGVGSYVVEALARTGVGKLSLFDNDTVSTSNINRQLVALHSTVGKLKTAVAKERIADINPKAEVFEYPMFFTAENADSIDFSQFDYVVDSIDTVSSKILLAQICQEKNIPIISSMGTGNKLDPTALTVTDITKTTVCPLARVMRRELKKRGISHLKVVFSTEEPKRQNHDGGGKLPPASVAFVPSVAGLIAAGEAVKDIIKN